MKTLVYIASMPRSGSTILANILGNHPEFFCAGEVDKLHSYLNHGLIGKEYDWKCPCGEMLHDCGVWGPVIQSVKAEFGIDNTSMTTRPDMIRRNLFDHLSGKYELDHLLKKAGASDQYANIARNNFALMDRLASHAAHIKGIIDSSKNAYTLASYLIHRPADWDLKVVHVIRDPRATALSMRKGNKRAGLPVPSFARALYWWRHGNRRLSGLGNTMSKQNYLCIHWERFCAEPVEHIQHLSDFLGKTMDPDVLLTTSGERHDLSGSPSMYKNKAELRLKADMEWESEMTFPYRLAHTILTKSHIR